MLPFGDIGPLKLPPVKHRLIESLSLTADNSRFRTRTFFLQSTIGVYAQNPEVVQRLTDEATRIVKVGRSKSGLNFQLGFQKPLVLRKKGASGTVNVDLN